MNVAYFVYLMVLAYLVGDVVAFNVVRAVHEVVRRGRP